MKIDITSTARVGQRITSSATILGLENVVQLPPEVIVADKTFHKPFIVTTAKGELVSARYASNDGTLFEVMGPFATCAIDDNNPLNQAGVCSRATKI